MALTNEDLQAIASLMDSKLQPINDRLDKLEAGQRELKKELRQIKDKVNDTYDLALEAWGQSTENRVWLDKTLKMPQ